MDYIFLLKKAGTGRFEEVQLGLQPTGDFADPVVINLTQAEYDALTQDEKLDNALYNIVDAVAGSVSIVNLTQAEYDVLTDQEKALNVIYNIPDAPEAATQEVPMDGTEGQVLTTNGSGGFTFEDAASGGIEEGSDVSLGVVTADSVLATSITSTGVGVANFSSTSSITLDAQDGVIVDGELDVNGLASLDGGIDVDGVFTVADTTGDVATTGTLAAGSTTLTGTLDVSGLATLQQTTEVTLALTGATGVVDHNISNGTVFDHTSLSANFTANFTNVPTTNSRTISIALILNQGGTAYMPTAVQIDGSAQTILWQGGSAPSGTASGVDVVSFTLVRSTSGAWSVIGSGTSYS